MELFKEDDGFLIKSIDDQFKDALLCANSTAQISDIQELTRIALVRKHCSIMRDVINAAGEGKWELCLCTGHIPEGDQIKLCQELRLIGLVVEILVDENGFADNAGIKIKWGK